MSKVQEAINRIKNKKTPLTSNDVADLAAKYSEQNAVENGKEYTKEDAARDRRNAWDAMHGINREERDY